MEQKLENLFTSKTFNECNKAFHPKMYSEKLCRVEMFCSLARCALLCEI